MFGAGGLIGLVISDDGGGEVLLLSMQKIVGSDGGMSHPPVVSLIQSLEIKTFHVVSCRVLYFTAGLLFGVGMKRG